MSNPINLWPHLPNDIQKELIKHAASKGADTIYIWRRPYYQRRNELILKRYRQLKASTQKSNKTIYEQIAQEGSEAFGTISVKAVELVVSKNSSNTWVFEDWQNTICNCTL